MDNNRYVKKFIMVKKIETYNNFTKYFNIKVLNLIKVQQTH